jgi:hypothetical protein
VGDEEEQQTWSHGSVKRFFFSFLGGAKGMFAFNLLKFNFHHINVLKCMKY